MLRSLIAALTLSAAAPVAGQELAHSTVALLPGETLPDGRYLAGVQVRLAPGWKTYWRVPGSGGIPPQFDWSGSRNIAAVDHVWPTPTLFHTYGLRSIGYEREVIFPVVLAPGVPGAPIDVALAFDYGVCAEVCIPARAELAARFDPAASLTAPALAAAYADGARDGAALGLAAACDIAPGPQAGQFTLTADISGTAPGAPAPPAIVELAHPDLWIHDAQSGGAAPLTVTAEMDWFGAGAFAAAREDIRITLLPPGARAIEIDGC